MCSENNNKNITFNFLKLNNFSEILDYFIYLQIMLNKKNIKMV